MKGKKGLEGKELVAFVIDKMKDAYITESEVCMAEFLAWETLPAGLTFEEAFEIYIRLMKWSDGDEFFVIKEGERIELPEGE